MKELPGTGTEYVPLVDTHCHLYFKQFSEDLESTVSRMISAGVAGGVVVGVDQPSSVAAQKLAERYPEFYFAAGLHPTSQFPARFIAEQYFGPYLAGCTKPVAIGECGIDLHWDTNPLERQADVFAQQLELASKRDLPVIVHTRDADEETDRVLRSVQGARGVLHCFNGSRLLLDFAIEYGWYVSFAGNLSYPKAQDLRQAAALVPIDRLLVETDAPYLSPQPVRGKRCEPAFVVYTAQTLAEARGIHPSELRRQLYENSCRCFGVVW